MEAAGRTSFITAFSCLQGPYYDIPLVRCLFMQREMAARIILRHPQTWLTWRKESLAASTMRLSQPETSRCGTA
jgi:hypothetical protein